MSDFGLSHHPLLQLLPGFKKRQFLTLNPHPFSGFRISSGIRFVFFDINGTQATDFNPVTVYESVGHFVENQVHNMSCVWSCKAGFFFQSIDEI